MSLKTERSPRHQQCQYACVAARSDCVAHDALPAGGGNELTEHVSTPCRYAGSTAHAAAPAPRGAVRRAPLAGAPLTANQRRTAPSNGSHTESLIFVRPGRGRAPQDMRSKWAKVSPEGHLLARIRADRCSPGATNRLVLTHYKKNIIWMHQNLGHRQPYENLWLRKPRQPPNSESSREP